MSFNVKNFTIKEIWKELHIQPNISIYKESTWFLDLDLKIPVKYKSDENIDYKNIPFFNCDFYELPSFKVLFTVKNIPEYSLILLEAGIPVFDDDLRKSLLAYKNPTFEWYYGKRNLLSESSPACLLLLKPEQTIKINYLSKIYLMKSTIENKIEFN